MLTWQNSSQRTSPSQGSSGCYLSKQLDKYETVAAKRAVEGWCSLVPVLLLTGDLSSGKFYIIFPLFQNRVPATEEALMASTSCFTVHYRSLIINLNINTIWFINIHTISTSKSKSLKIPPVHFLAKFLIAHIILRNLCIKDILLVAISNLKRFVQGNASTAQRYWSWREQKCLLVIFEYYSLIIDTVDGTFDASIFYHSSKLWLAHTPVARY